MASHKALRIFFTHWKFWNGRIKIDTSFKVTEILKSNLVLKELKGLNGWFLIEYMKFEINQL